MSEHLAIVLEPENLFQALNVAQLPLATSTTQHLIMEKHYIKNDNIEVLMHDVVFWDWRMFRCDIYVGGNCSCKDD